MAKVKKENFDDKELSLKNEIFAIFSLFFSFFLIFSLVSFTPLDPSFFNSSHGRLVHNFGGRVGAELAAL
ncbi:MAG TPA: DNA translocase FtsK 4TM domain-containing protein, partial [Acidobacteriota bacterium]